MKRFILSLLILSVLNVFVVYAKPGDIAGEYYSTDILTTLNGKEIDAINIGGQTLISAEDMCNYGFSVVWDGENRTLDVYSLLNIPENVPPVPEKPDIPAGEAIGHYYETDIVTLLDGIPITAFNIGGRTYMHAEEMRNFGYTVDWNPEKWTLSILSPRSAGHIYTIPVYFGDVKTKEGIGTFSVHDQQGIITCTGDADYFDLRFARNKNEYDISLSFYQNKGLFYSTALQQSLSKLCYDGISITPCNPEDKYDEINDVLTISVNGYVASNIEIYKSGGNGHRDYNIKIKDLPLFTQDEIKDIYISLGGETGRTYEIIRGYTD